MKCIDEHIKRRSENDTDFLVLGDDQQIWGEFATVYGLSGKPTPSQDSAFAGEGSGYHWSTDIRAHAGGWWVETTLTVTEPVSIDPSMILWLGALDNMNDRQAHTWRQTILRAPTTNQQGLPGNDLPACYLYDHAQKRETICYFPADSFAWAENRFYHFTMRDVIQYHPQARYGIGLILNPTEQALPFAEGTYQMRWWFSQATRETVPTPWEAQQIMLARITPLFDPVPTQTPDALLWSEMAQRTLDDLQHEACWTEADGVRGLRAYVKGSSTQGRDAQHGFELMTQLDVLLPLTLWREAQTTPNPTLDATIDALIATLRGFNCPNWNFIANHFPLRGDHDAFMDTWYFLENALIKLPYVAFLSDDEALKTMFFSAIQGARTLARNTHYLFPLFADARDWKARQSVLNVSVGGMYAAGCIIAYQLRNDPRDLQEAMRALQVIHQLHPAQLTHEPQQLSYGAAAAQFIADEMHDPQDQQTWSQIAADLVNLSLRMGYWERDPAVPFYDPRGMIQACASLAYPAYKENVETLWAWSELINADPSRTSALPIDLMALIANWQRAHNYAFFDPYIPASMRKGPCPYIPYEDVATAEFTHTAELGKEIYGAGEVFVSALMFDTFGHIAHPAVLCLSLDVPCLRLRRTSEIPQESRRFIIYNPLGEPCKTHFHSPNQTPLALTLPPQSLSLLQNGILMPL